MTTQEVNFNDLALKERMNIVRTVLHDAIQCVVLHPVCFELVWRDLVIRECDYEPTSEGWEWDTVVFPQCTSLKVHSKCTGNKDVRGGGCGDMCFSAEDFVWTVETPDGITLRHLTEGVYRMKGSKYDWWYELFDGIGCQSIENGRLTIEVDFDYAPLSNRIDRI